MIRFIRNVIIFIMVLAGLLVMGLWFLNDACINRIEAPMTKFLIAQFGPGEDDTYSYTARLRFYPFIIEVEDLTITASTLRLDEPVYSDCVIEVDRMTLDAMQLIRYEEIAMLSVEGKSFSGLLPINELEKLIVRNSENASDLEIAPYNDHCRITGRMGPLRAIPTTIIGDWIVDDRSVITLGNREYHNPDSQVPLGMVISMEENLDLDVRIRLFGGELEGTGVTFGREGLEVSAMQD